jgi:uncharacterized protein (DUF488 family)
MAIRLFTIGFAETSAESFFTTLCDAGVKRVIDVRLNNTSQLAAYSKKDDLRYFLRQIGGIDYLHVPELAPTQEMLDAYKKQKGSWADYEAHFGDLIRSRHIERAIAPETAHLGCLLCSEKDPAQCHRRIVAEYLAKVWGDTEIVHLGTPVAKSAKRGKR